MKNGLVIASPLVKERSGRQKLRLRAVVDGVANRVAVRMFAPEASRTVLAVLIDGVKLNMEHFQPFRKCPIIPRYAMQGFQACIGG